MDPLRAWLLTGLIIHKAVWEIMKRERPRTRPAVPLKTRLVKGVKVAILLGIVIQTLVPDVLPLARDASAVRAVGAVMYTAGLALALAGRIQLGSNWSDIETAGVERGQAVVSHGVYRWIRHPIYSGDLLLLLGLELALNSWLVLGVVLLAPVVLSQAIREEKMLAGKLRGYEEYRRRTKRFIPFVA